MQVLLERPAEVIQCFLPHQAIALAIWTVFFCPKNLRTLDLKSLFSLLLNCLSRSSIGTVLPSSGPKISGPQVFVFRTSNLEFMKEEIFFSPPRMPVASIDRLRIPGALFHFILLAGGGRTLKLGPQVRRCDFIARCVSPAVAGHGRCAEFPSWLKIAGCF